MAMRRFVLSGVLTIMFVFVAACGGGDDGGEPTDTAQETTSPEGTPALEGAAREVSELLAEGITATFKVKYETASPDGAQGDTFVVYNKPPDTRIDTLSANGAESDSAIIGGDESTETYGCTGGPDAWSCESIAPLGDSLLTAAGPVAYLQPSDLELFDISETEDRTVADQSTRCFALTPREGTATEAGEYCFNSEGVPLYVQTSSETVEASEFSTDVSDQDFEPPVAPATPAQ